MRGETDYRNIRVHARTKAELDGESATIEKVTTLPPSMRELLVKEIQRVQEVEGDFVDTEFYTGFVQREYKPDYLARLKADLAEAYAAEKAALDISEEDQAKAKSRWKTSALGTMGARAFAEAAPEPEEEEDEETLMERAVPDYARKRRPVEHRLQGRGRGERERYRLFQACARSYGT